ncbi:hypothetical protein E6R60_05920 [Streptomyces sp. A0642]|uniref:hypothetical protein n=1 Tax=Streptomyces sp. A0642 TaxID=2563100 RepID=UPI0010A250E6|nr:hypothetical protein [Streptomyces sp. A0642]THA78419.1 hypothetical protein E6R60_05920 [Streptomyces sp. A0642]
MPVYAGQSVSARMLNRLRPEPISAAGTADLTVTGTTTLIPGCEITLTVETAGARIIADGSVNFLNGATALTASSFCSAQLVLDGATIPTFARWGDVAAGSQGTPSKQWDIPGLSAGSHTLRLAAARTSAGTGTVTAVGIHCQLLVWLYEPVV